MISVNRLLKRRSPFTVNKWIMDSGAYTRITKDGKHLSSRKYASEILRWGRSNTLFLSLALCPVAVDCLSKTILHLSKFGFLLAAVTQDYMCESHVLKITRLTIQQHQRATIARYDNLIKLAGNSDVYLMPVLQGFAPNEYVYHLRMYGDRIQYGAWVGVGSVCKRNGSPSQIENILLAIKKQRPDLRLHGFGLKKTALKSEIVNELLYSVDSQAHGYRARKAIFHEGGSKYSANDPRCATVYLEEMQSTPIQRTLLFDFYLSSEKTA